MSKTSCSRKPTSVQGVASGKPLVYIIVLCWNGKRWLRNCLSAALATDYSNFKIVLVDNASSDNSPEFVEEYFPQIKLIKNKKNLGFAEGNNIGIRYALKEGTEYIVLLNQDTKVDPHWLTGLIDVAEGDEKIGILSPMQFDYEGNEIDVNFFELLNTNKQFEENYKKNEIKKTYELSRVIGSAMLIKRKLCEKIGLLDSFYFLYHEETDFCRRALYHDFKIVCVTDSRIYHWHGLIDKEGMNKISKYLFLRNTFVYLLKDPERLFIDNLKAYFIWGGAKNIIKSFGSLKNIRYFLKISYIQVWILIYLPLIGYKHCQERKRACYLVSKRT